MRTAPEPAVVARMRAAHRRARETFGVRLDRRPRAAWGWRGRTLGLPVTADGDPTWLRVASALPDDINPTFWNGALEAARAIPATVPRPRLREVRDWTAGEWVYRAELYARVISPTVSPSATLTQPVNLPDAWWAELRQSLDAIAEVPTDRYTIHPGYIKRAVPRVLGVEIDVDSLTWTTAHGDLHFANLCGPTLQILDWEGWGLAPAGYDAAMLHAWSLRTPTTASEIRRRLSAQSTANGLAAELIAITELLHAGNVNRHLTGRLRARATPLLRDAGSPIS